MMKLKELYEAVVNPRQQFKQSQSLPLEGLKQCLRCRMCLLFLRKRRKQGALLSIIWKNKFGTLKGASFRTQMLTERLLSGVICCSRVGLKCLSPLRHVEHRSLKHGELQGLGVWRPQSQGRNKCLGSHLYREQMR